MTGMDAVSLRLHSGIPVIDFQTQASENAEEALHTLVAALADAGHFEVILNLAPAAALTASLMQTLERTARILQAHCGNLMVVQPETPSGAAERLPLQNIHLFRTEMEALAHVKRTRLLSPGQICRAYISPGNRNAQGKLPLVRTRPWKATNLFSSR